MLQFSRLSTKAGLGTDTDAKLQPAAEKKKKGGKRRCATDCYTPQALTCKQHSISLWVQSAASKALTPAWCRRAARQAAKADRGARQHALELATDSQGIFAIVNSRLSNPARPADPVQLRHSSSSARGGKRGQGQASLASQQEDMRHVKEQISRLQATASRNAESTVIGKQAAAKLKLAHSQLQRMQKDLAGSQAEADRTKRQRQFEGKF